jgi:3-hydroxybutyryl-CoA dehydratase
MKGKTIKELKIGDKDSYQKTISETDVYLFAGITGDNNPAHLNEVEAKNSMFGGRIAHGMLSAGFGDTIKAEVEVIEINEEKNIVKFATNCYNQDNKVVIKGTATVMPPK